MWYELWDAETNNRVGLFETEQAALEAVCEDAQRHGHDSDVVTTLGLLAHDPTHVGGRLIAEGPELVALALNSSGRSQRLSA